jgi:hypothetical protein
MRSVVASFDRVQPPSGHGACGAAGGARGGDVTVEAAAGAATGLGRCGRYQNKQAEALEERSDPNHDALRPARGTGGVSSHAAAA